VFSPGCGLAGFPQEKLRWRIKSQEDAYIWAQRQATVYLSNGLYSRDFGVVLMVNLTPQHFACSNELHCVRISFIIKLYLFNLPAFKEVAVPRKSNQSECSNVPLDYLAEVQIKSKIIIVMIL